MQIEISWSSVPSGAGFSGSSSKNLENNIENKGLIVNI
jgi:hypothetical protein